jgi:hypothetical protein
MRALFPRRTKPPAGTPLDPGNSLCQGLVVFYPCNGGGNTVVDGLIGTTGLAGLGLPLAGGALWGSGTFGTGLVCNVSNARAQVNWPAALNFGWPISIACSFTVLGAQASLGLIFGLWPTPSAFFFSSGQVCSSFFNSAHSVLVTTAIGSTYTVGWSQYLTSTGGLTTLGIGYVNGSQVITSATALGTAEYSSTNAAFGDSTSFSGRNCNLIFNWGGVWSRVINADEHRRLAINPWEMFPPPYGIESLLGGGVKFRRSLFDRVGSRGGY